MALINTGSDYTRTGENFFSRWANKLSMIPGAGAPLAMVFGSIGTVVDAAGWLFRGKIGSAATALAAGAASTVVNTGQALPGGELMRLGLTWGSGITTGSSLGTHARAATEGAIGMLTGALGARPTVLRSYTAGVGSIGGGNSGPGYYATRAAQERGQDPNAMWNNYRNGAGADHVSALEASRAMGPAQRGA